MEDRKLTFRNAFEAEAPALKALYEEAWGCGIMISEAQIRSKIRNFPEGQIVGCDESGKPLSMINMMLAGFDQESGFPGGYEAVSGGRTFSTHVPYDELITSGKLPVAFCFSIAVLKAHAKHGYATETLNYAIAFAEENGIIAVPYSAPRGFGAARKANPELDIITYLHMTGPSDESYDEHMLKIDLLNEMPRILRAFRPLKGGEAIRAVTKDIYDAYQAIGPDSFSDPRKTAYAAFLAEDGEGFRKIYGRTPTIEDFCMLSGRKLRDPVMRMHVENGARFIRNGSGRLTSIFEDSRPEDSAALGYNILLTYGYHPLLGQSYVEDFHLI
jgi:GNAT superfamily N-acetyltransferase